MINRKILKNKLQNEFYLDIDDYLLDKLDDFIVSKIIPEVIKSVLPKEQGFPHAKYANQATIQAVADIKQKAKELYDIDL